MLRALTKATAYMRAPRKTFVLLHPWKTVKIGATFLFAKWLFTGIRRTEDQPSEA